MAEHTEQSQQTIVTKLGYVTHDAVFAVGAPQWYMESLLQSQIITPNDLLYFEDYANKLALQHTEKLWLHGFFVNKADIDAADFLNTLYYTSWEWDGVWVSWPNKKHQPTVESNLSEQHFLEILPPLGWKKSQFCELGHGWNALLFNRHSP